MYPVKQSTALDVLFFAHDANGDAVTGKVDANWTKRISQNGSAFSGMTVTITERENGWYHLQLSTSHTNTLGILSLTFTASGVKQVNMQFRVHARVLDDLAYPNVSGRGVDVDATGGVEITADQDVNVNQWRGSAPNVLVSGRVDASVGAMVADVITASALNTSAVGEIADGVWDEDLTGHTTADTAGRDLRVLDAISDRANNSDLNALLGVPDAAAHTVESGLDAIETDTQAIEVDTQDIQSRLPAALVGGRMDSDVAVIQANAVTASALATDAVNEIADGVWDEDIVAAHTGADTAGRCLATLDGISDRLNNSNLNALLGVPDAAAHTVESGLDAIETDTSDIQGRLPAALVSGRIDASVGAMAADVLTASALATSAVDEIVDAVWDEDVDTSHQIPGSAGKKLDDAGAAADPWNTALPGAYGAGTAGYILGTNLDATVSSRSDFDETTDPVELLDSGGAAGTSAAELVDDVWDENIVAAHTGADTAGRCLATLDGISDRLNNSNLNALLGVPDAAAHTVESGLDAIETDTQDIQSRLPAALVSGRIDASVGAMAANVLTASALATDAVDEVVDAVWDEDLTGHTTADTAGRDLRVLDAISDRTNSSDLNSLLGVPDAAAHTVESGLDSIETDTADIQSRLPAALVGGAMDSDVSAIQANAVTAAALAADAGTEIANALLDLTAGVETGMTLRQAMRVVLSACGGKASGLATTTAKYRDTNDTKDRITATVDANGNRLAVTLDAT